MGEVPWSEKGECGWLWLSPPARGLNEACPSPSSFCAALHRAFRTGNLNAKQCKLKLTQLLGNRLTNCWQIATRTKYEFFPRQIEVRSSLLLAAFRPVQHWFGWLAREGGRRKVEVRKEGALSLSLSHERSPTWFRQEAPSFPLLLSASVLASPPGRQAVRTSIRSGFVREEEGEDEVVEAIFGRVLGDGRLEVVIRNRFVQVGRARESRRIINWRALAHELVDALFCRFAAP